MTRTCQAVRVGTVDPGKAFRRTAWTSCGGLETPLLLSFVFPQQVWAPWCVPLCDRGWGSAWLPMPLSLPLLPPAGGLTNSLPTPPSPAEPRHPLARGPPLPWAQGAETNHRPQDFIGTCLEGTSAGYWVFELTSHSCPPPWQAWTSSSQGQLLSPQGSQAHLPITSSL